MNQLQHKYSLRYHNTFNFDIYANHFFTYSNILELEELAKGYDFHKNKFYILGEGSNTLFRGDFEGLIIHPNNKGIAIINDQKDDVLIEVQAGESWDDFVNYCVENNFYGIENLSLIPGSCGAAPIQNIGAYGVEVKDVIENVKFLNIETKKIEVLNYNECKFNYRDSIFKNELKNKTIITSISVKLFKKPNYNLTYGNLNEEFHNSKNRDLKDLREIIIKTRESKLPDHKIIGNAGSFFKNPIISTDKYHILKELYSDIPQYPQSENEVKIPAGWLIEKAGYKGHRKNNVGVYEKQALVLVHYGNGKPFEIINLAEEIIDRVFEIFNIKISPEVNII